MAWNALADLVIAGHPADPKPMIDALLDAHEGADSFASVALARVMLTEIEIDGFDPVALLCEAAEVDNPKAQAILEELEDEIDEDDRLHDILPHMVVPDGMKRPKLVRDALTRETGMPAAVAETMTARFHGFLDWGRLKNAAEDPRRPKGPFDEECGALVFDERREIQAEIAVVFGFADEGTAAVAVRLLSPTSRKGKPSLRRLGERLEGRMFPFGPKELSDRMEGFLSSMGFDGDMDALQTLFPIAPGLL
ncbi:hypothetical protein [Mesorhizobium sp. B2-4-3]|uniref:hypothetical protein n=1 Tax=Mesorhizobium sp. B2-4-3 TaxID=2589946 RepID=UPI001AEEE44F|nr:hypothetical protein [Mesorhizobium sp. B2-4-3]